MKQIIIFWNYFKNNEQEIINTFFLGINGDEIYGQFKKKLDNISNGIGFEITKPSNNQDKCRIIFTAYGGKNGQIDHHFPEQIDHQFRFKLTT
jgi:hypothetical protein